MQKRNKNSLLFFLGATLLCASGNSQTPYTFNAFLRSVLETSPLSQRATNAGDYGKLQLRAARGNFDPVLSSGLENKQFNSYHYYTNGVAELKQPIYTSHYLKAGYQYGQGPYLNPERSTPAIGLPYVGVEASLLQGFAFDKRRADLIKATHYSEFYSAEQKIQINAVLFEAANAYAEALYLQRITTLYGYFVDLAAQRLKGIGALSQVGERPAVDTIEAAIFFQGRLLDQRAAEIELIGKVNALRVLHPIEEVPPAMSLTTDSLGQVYQAVLTNIRNLMIAERPTHPVLVQYRAKQGVLDAEQRLKREMIKPVLNLNYNFLNGSTENLAVPVGLNNYKWGAAFSFPIFLRKSRNEYKIARIDARNNELEMMNKDNQLKQKRDYLLKAIRIALEQVTNAERSAAYSKLLVDAERLKFSNGESSLFLLNTRENKWLETELKLADYQLKIIKAFAELTYVNGDLRYELE